MTMYDKTVFYLGTLCKRNHRYENSCESLRYIKGNHCVICRKMYDHSQRYYRKNRDECLRKSKIYYAKNAEKKKKQGKAYYVANKERILERDRIYGAKYRKKNRSRRRLYERKYSKDNIRFRISKNIRCCVAQSLKGNKHGQHWETLVGYTLKELMTHLEKQFTDGMTWENYGKWHIDHVVPISLFSFESYNDLAFKECWHLHNLQPLWATDNIRKGNRYMG